MRTDSKWLRIGLFAGLVGLAGTAWAQEDAHCDDDAGSDDPTTPSSAFIDQGNGTVVHEESGLQWSRCAIGQTFRDGSCEGSAQVYFWEEASDAVERLNAAGGMAGYTDWRLPELEELLSIVEDCRDAPAVNPDIFPNTPWTGFWTATLHRDADDPHEAEHVDNPAYRGAHPEDEDEEDDATRTEQEKNPEAWFVGFYKGLEYPYDIYSSYRVRPVRTR